MSADNNKTLTKAEDDLALVHKTERCVESILKKTTFGAVAPLGLLLFTSRLKVIGSFMLLGAGVGMGMGINQCKYNTISNVRANIKDKVDTAKLSAVNAKENLKEKVDNAKVSAQNVKENLKEKVDNVKATAINAKDNLKETTKETLKEVAKESTPNQSN